MNRQDLIKIKSLVFELEKTNNEYIILFPSSSDERWWKMGGNSALFYANFYAQLIHGKKKELSKDNDYYSNFKYGTISFFGSSSITTKLESIKLTPVEARKIIKKITDDTQYLQKIIIFHTRKFSNNEIYEMKHEKEKISKKATRYLLAENSDPELFSLLRSLCETIENIVRKMEPTYREIHGIRTAQVVYAMEKSFINFSRGEISKQIFQKKIKSGIDWLRTWLIITEHNNFCSIDKRLEIIESILEVDKKINEK